MALSNGAPRRVVIFDRPGGDRGGFGLRERIAACYRFARRNGWSVAEVCDTSQRTSRAELDRALTICVRTGAGLLVYRAEVVGRRTLGDTLLLETCAGRPS